MQELHSLLSRVRAAGWLPLSVTGVSSVAIVVGWLYLSPATLVVIVGLLVSILLGMAVAHINQRPAPASLSAVLETPFNLAQDGEVFTRYQHFADSLLQVSRQRDSIFRELAFEHLDELVRRSAAIAEGTFVFEGTETWRIVYERLLRSPGLHLYRSVAWMKNENYWQDEPARKSMAVNFELHAGERLNIERIAIIADELWPAEIDWPTERVRQWLHEQHAHGIRIKFVRETTLKNEPDLVADFGIYGSRAVGHQELDDQCRTMRFTLTFDFARVAEAEDRWNRLAVYAESFASYLDRYELPG